MSAFRADSARGLLAYLAMHPGVVFRREALATLFWSERDQEAALVNLRQILAILRRVLGDAETEQPFLEITPRTIRFDPEPGVWVDVNVFQKLANSSGGLRAGTHRMKQALALYRGDILSDAHISSPAFDEWLIQQREHLHQCAVDILHSLTNYHERRGEAEMVKYYAQHQLELEPWSEEAYRQLMLAYAQLGQRSAALKQYALCQRALNIAFGVEPAVKIKTLYRKIADDDTAGVESEFCQAPHNLSLPISPFENENSVTQLEERLLAPDVQLVTLVGEETQVGPLALAVANVLRGAFADGVWFISFADCDTFKNSRYDPVISQIADTFKVVNGPSAARRSQLLDYLSRKELLLVFDHVDPAQTYLARFLTELLSRSTRLVILSAAQQSLNLKAETVIYFPVA